jgi:hypothetical protein
MGVPLNVGRTALRCGAALAALLGIAALTAALAVHRPELVRPWVERALTPRGGSASLAVLKVSLAPLSLELSGLTIAGPGGEGDLLRADLLRFEIIPARYLLGEPWLRHVEARGLVLERTRPRETEGPPDLAPLNRLFDLEDLAVSNARVRVALPQGEFSAESLDLRVARSQAGIRAFSGDGTVTLRLQGQTEAAGRLSVSGTVVSGPVVEATLELGSARLTTPWLSGDISGRSRLRLDLKRLHVDDLVLSLPQGHARIGPRGTRIPAPIHLKAAASAMLTGEEPRAEVFALDIGELLHAKGRLAGTFMETISGTLSGNIPRVAPVKAVLAPLLPDRLAGMDLDGNLAFRLDLSRRGTDRMLALELSPKGMLFSWSGAGFDFAFGGSLRAEGPLPSWRAGEARLSGHIRGTGNLDRPTLSVRRLGFDALLAGAVTAPTLPKWELSVGKGGVTSQGRPLPLGRLVLRGSATLSTSLFRVQDLDIRSEALGHLAGDVVMRSGTLGGRLNGKGLPVDNLASLAGALGGPQWEAWSPTGAADLSVRLQPTEDGSLLHAAATVAGVGFISPAGDAMGQNLAGSIAVEASLVKRPRAKVDLAVRRGEALWGTVYVDLGKAPLTVHAEGGREAPQQYENLVLDGRFGEFGRLTVEGTARRAGGSWLHRGHLALNDARLGPMFRTFVRDPLAASNSDLAGLEMDGTATLDLSFAGTGQTADLAGALTVRGGDLRRASAPPLLAGLEIDLPFAYSAGASHPELPAPADATRWGLLRLKELRVAGQDLGPLAMPAVLVPNRLYLAGAIEASPFGARLSLRRIEVDDPLSDDFRIRLAASLNDLDLARVAGDNSVLQGHLGGALDPVTISRERLTATGELTGELFGGRLEIRHLTVERPFGAGREIGADVTADRIDLERLSAALGIGRITGRLSGSVDGLRLAYGQPVAFHLKMMSVPAEGVTQSVSLKAVNSISLVSTGSALSGLGASLMTTFFREFPYAKIGFACDLKNDVFTVRGLIHEDGVEYLVKRSFFGGINVINRNPDNRIGFSDMLERARRVTGERSE